MLYLTFDLFVYIPIHSRWLDPEIRDLKEQQQRCLSRIDDLEYQHQSNRSTPSSPKGDNWDKMRNKVNEETRKEIQFLETKKQQYTDIDNEFKALKSAKDSGTLPSEKWQEKLKDLAKREKDLQDERRQRKRLVLDISENGRIGVTCTHEDWSDWPLLMWR